MITAAEYRQLRKEFMEKYDLAVRNWLINVKNCDKAIVDEIPLFKDGVVCPEKWVENKTFRPLFIMKEPSTGLESDENTVLNDLKNYKKEWCRNEFDLVEDKFDDIQIGNSGTWMRVAKLTRALKETLDGEYTGCDNYDFRFVESVEENPLYHKLSTDQKEKYRYRTANENYKNEIERIAVLNIKKLGSGKKTTSKLSEIGKNFSLYIKDGEVGDLIYRQISDIIKPQIAIPS